MNKKPKPRCKNCGDETSFPRTTDMEREGKGWCTSCYRTWKQNCRYKNGREQWRDSMEQVQFNAYSSRPNHPAEDS